MLLHNALCYIHSRKHLMSMLPLTVPFPYVLAICALNKLFLWTPNKQLLSPTVSLANRCFTSTAEVTSLLAFCYFWLSFHHFPPSQMPTSAYLSLFSLCSLFSLLWQSDTPIIFFLTHTFTQCWHLRKSILTEQVGNILLHKALWRLSLSYG